jgi:hypothetical protein
MVSGWCHSGGGAQRGAATPGAARRAGGADGEFCAALPTALTATARPARTNRSTYRVVGEGGGETVMTATAMTVRGARFIPERTTSPCPCPRVLT